MTVQPARTGAMAQTVTRTANPRTTVARQPGTGESIASTVATGTAGTAMRIAIRRIDVAIGTAQSANTGVMEQAAMWTAIPRTTVAPKPGTGELIAATVVTGTAGTVTRTATLRTTVARKPGTREPIAPMVVI